MKYSHLKGGLILSLLFLGGIILSTITHLAVSPSGSLKGIRYVLFLKGGPFRRGDIVLIRNHPTKYFKNLSYSKRVLALPGDTLSVVTLRVEALRANTFHVNTSHVGTRCVSTLPLLKRTLKGEPLTPLRAQVVPPGYVFVGGDHPRSFDSRYEEFGLVPFEKIWGRGILAW